MGGGRGFRVADGTCVEMTSVSILGIHYNKGIQHSFNKPGFNLLMQDIWYALQAHIAVALIYDSSK